ncbi:MAG: hypothetical protein PVF74_00895 [Anaerolineales bacterium]|jgi:hypothetical protein
MYKVFHNQPLYPGMVFQENDILISELDWPDRYQEVARVDVDDLEEAYLKTQHLEKPWWLNPGVKVVNLSRSTSVGDVIQDENGTLWVVAAIGFVKLIQQKNSQSQ